MKATVILKIGHDVELRLKSGREYGLDTFRSRHDDLRVGDVIDVERRPNSPYLYRTEK